MAVVVLAGSVVMSGGSALAQSKFCSTTSTGINPSNGQPFPVDLIQQISGNCTNPSQDRRFFGGCIGVAGDRRSGRFVNDRRDHDRRQSH